MPSGTLKTLIGELTFRTSPLNGIVVLKGEKLRFEGQSYRFTARLEKMDDKWMANILSLVPVNPAKFKLQTCKAILLTKLPDCWIAHLKLHKSMVFIADKQAAEADRKAKLRELQQLIERVEVLVAQAKPILASLLE